MSPPNYRTISTVDQSEIWPYFSAAVVVTEGVQIGQDWIDHERTLFDHGFDDTYLLGQVALAILASELQVSELTEQQNYPLAHRFYTKRDTELVHYQESRYLLKTWGRRDELRSIGIWSEITDDWDFDSRWLRTIWDWKQCLRDQFYWRTGGSGVRDRDNYDIEF